MFAEHAILLRFAVHGREADDRFTQVRCVCLLWITVTSCHASESRPSEMYAAENSDERKQRTPFSTVRRPSTNSKRTKVLTLTLDHKLANTATCSHAHSLPTSTNSKGRPLKRVSRGSQAPLTQALRTQAVCPIPISTLHTFHLDS